MVATLISELHENGVRLGLHDGRLTCSAPPGILTSELQARIQDVKADIVAILQDANVSKEVAYPVQHVENQSTYPLSSAQRRTLMTSHRHAILPAAFRLSGHLDISVLELTLNQFVCKHAPLRSKFNLEGRNPSQSVQDYKIFNLESTTLSDGSDKKLYAELENIQALGVDPQNGICFRFKLIELSNQDHVLFAAFSPIVFDGWSFDLFWNELTEGYTALLDNKDWINPPLEFSYADCTAWLHKRLTKRKTELESFWHNQLGDILPLDVFSKTSHPNPDRETETIPFSLDSDTTIKLRNIATEVKTTPQVILLAAIYVWAYRLRGVVEPNLDDLSAEDIVLGIAVEGRPHVGLENVVGPFANLLLMREGNLKNEKFVDFLSRVQNDLLRCHQHQEYPIDYHNIRSRPGSTRTFQIEFSFQQTTGRAHNMGPVQIKQIELRSGTSAVDLSFWVKDWGEKIAGAVEYRRSTFITQEANQWIRCFHALLNNLLNNPDSVISKVELLGQKDNLIVTKSGADSGSSVTDEYGQLLPFGIPGKVEKRKQLYILRSNGTLDEFNAPYRITHCEEQYLWPQTDLQLRLELILQNILGSRIGIKANFFDAGLNSLLALHFVSECQEKLDISINVPALFKYPTIFLLSEYIDSGHKSSEVSTLVPLQSNGSMTPLYCICGINLYRPLAIALGENQPTYAIYIPDERNILSTNSSRSACFIAKEYWKTIKLHHTGGPLRLLGFCFGGALAYEIALAAREEGYEIEQLILVDTALSRCMKRRLRSRIAQKIPSSLRNKIKDILGISSVEYSTRTEPKDSNILATLSAQLDKFKPMKTYDGNTIMVDSGDKEMYSAWHKTPLVGWESVLTGSVRHIRLHDKHISVLNPVNSEYIASHIYS